MSQQDVELVRAYFATVEEQLLARRADPNTPLQVGVDLLFDQFLGPEAVWHPPFSPHEYVGREGWARASQEWLEAAGDWQVELDELFGGKGGRFLAVLRVFIRGRESAAAYGQRTYTVIEVENGRIARVVDYTEKAEALAAAGLPPDAL